MTDPLTAALKVAEVLGPELVKVGARRVKRQILGTRAERGMQSVYTRAIAGLLVELVEAEESAYGGPDPEVMKVAETVLKSLCSDEEAAALLLNVALRPGPIPVKALYERATALGYAPDTLPFGFDGAMGVLTEKVWEEFMVESTKENSLIQGLVNRELLESVREHDQALQVASAAERVNLLPPPPELVLGRAEELTRAKHALGVFAQEEAEGGPSYPSRRVVAVHGWPGIGKSTFIAVLCRDEEVLQRFSDGVIFVPVGLSPEVRRLAEEVCAALGVPAPPGTTLDVLRGRIADALAWRSVLVVFDDVWEESHVAPLLLASGGSAALVATRRPDVATRLSTGPEGPLKLSLLSED